MCLHHHAAALKALPIQTKLLQATKGKAMQITFFGATSLQTTARSYTTSQAYGMNSGTSSLILSMLQDTTYQARMR